MSISRAAGYVLVLSVWLVTAPRLPAPIQEIPENPTPTPKAAQTPEPTKSRVKPKSKASTSQVIKSTPKPQASAKTSRFAGIWSGTMPEVPWGNVQTELIVDPTETTMEWRDSLSAKHGTAKAQLNGNTLSALFPGWPRPVWSITPDPGGNTAQVRLQAFMNDDHAVFRKSSQTNSAKAAR